MEVEQRCDEKRIEISRPIEFLDPEIGLGITGYTKNLSTSGLRARVDQAPSAGEVVQLEIALADETSPLETQGEVVWCAPDIYGDGAEIGLKFLARSSGDEGSLDADNNVPAETLQPGQQVTINVDGRVVYAVVSDVLREGSASQAGAKISLHILGDEAPVEPDAAADEPADEQLLEEAERWKAHPFRDMKNWFKKYGGPVVAVLTAVAVPLAKATVKGSAKLWSLLPKRLRRPMAKLVIRLDIPRRSAQLKKLAVKANSYFSDRIAAYRSTRSAKQTGDA